MQLTPVAVEDYAVLAAVEAAMARSTLTAPVSGGSHSAFRSAVEGSTGGSRALAQSLAGACQAIYMPSTCCTCVLSFAHKI